MSRRRWLLAAAVAAAACSSSHPTRPPATTPATTTSSTAASTTAAATATTAASTSTTARPATTTASPPAAAAPAADWPTYHGDPARTGATTAGPTGPLHVVWEAHVPGQIYAEPVAAGGMVVVATEQDVVAALDASTGAVRWSTSLGTPVTASSLPCGDITPVSGITGTPVVDAGLVHVVAFLAPAHHELVALDLRTGAVRSRRGIDPPGLSPTVEQQRGALTVAGGQVYVPYGGLYGDCGAYKGAVVDDRGQSWEVPAAGGAVWAPPGPTIAAGDLFIATGNTSSATFGDDDSVVRLSPSLQQQDVFAPSNWSDMARSDADLGSTSPVPVSGLLLETGKTGVAYLLDPGHLGGIGGEITSAHVCRAAYGGTATTGGVVFDGCSDGVVAVAVQGRTIRAVWHGPDFVAGSPAVIGGRVLVLDVGAGDLVSLDPRTGAQTGSIHVGPVAHFATPGLASGRVVVGTMDGNVLGFG